MRFTYPPQKPPDKLFDLLNLFNYLLVAWEVGDPGREIGYQKMTLFLYYLQLFTNDNINSATPKSTTKKCKPTRGIGLSQIGPSAQTLLAPGLERLLPNTHAHEVGKHALFEIQVLIFLFLAGMQVRYTPNSGILTSALQPTPSQKYQLLLS